MLCPCSVLRDVEHPQLKPGASPKPMKPPPTTAADLAPVCAIQSFTRRLQECAASSCKARQPAKLRAWAWALPASEHPYNNKHSIAQAILLSQPAAAISAAFGVRARAGGANIKLTCRGWSSSERCPADQCPAVAA